MIEDRYWLSISFVSLFFRDSSFREKQCKNEKALAVVQLGLGRPGWLWLEAAEKATRCSQRREWPLEACRREKRASKSGGLSISRVLALIS